MNNKVAKVWTCIDCGVVVGRRVKRCNECHRKACSSRSKYKRSDETRHKMSLAAKGRKHDYCSASTRPEVALKIQQWWTPERKEQKRIEMLSRNPDARYHGLSSDAAREFVQSVGKCQNCGGDGSESRLSVHHIYGNKHNQSADNLTVLCHRCHMQEHERRGETGFDVMWRKRKTILD